MEVRLQVYGSGTRNKSSGLIRGFSRAKRHATVDAVERNARRCSFFEHLQPAWVVGGGHAGTRSANPHCSHHRCTPCQPPPLTWRSARHPTLRRGARRSARRASGSPNGAVSRTAAARRWRQTATLALIAADTSRAVSLDASWRGLAAESPRPTSSVRGRAAEGHSYGRSQCGLGAKVPMIL